MVRRIAIAILYFQLLVGLSWSQAPGDETCTITPYLDTEKNLMDSRNYIYLLPGNGTGRNIQAGAVWNDYSFDRNDEINIFTGTFWRHGVAGNCRRTADICGFDRSGTAQNNWLFTQHISKSFDSNTYNYPVTIHVNITYRMTGCRDDRQPPCIQGFTLFYYLTNSVRLPSLEGNGYMNRDNYQSFAYPYAPENGENYVNIYNFTLPSTSTGFYVAARDNGTCTSIRRLRVYRENCKEQRIGLVLYPDAPAPVSGSVNINVQCVENAEFASGQSMASCTGSGEWGTITPDCQCRLGYERTEVNSLSQCRACPAGKYRSVTDTACQTCPTKTITTEVAAPICACPPGCFRKNFTGTGNPFCSGIEPASAGCTQPPSAPRDESSTVQENSMTVRWSTPADNGGRGDLHYLLILRDPAVPNTFINKTYLAGDRTTITFYNLKPFTQYCVQVIAHNCVSDQDSGRTQTRTVEVCNKTLEGVPGTVTGVQGTYPYVVWNPPADLNGVISGYRLVFSRSGTSTTRTRTTNTDQTFYIIQSSDIPWTSGEFRVTVSARNRAGFGPQSSTFTLPLDACNPTLCQAKTEGLVRYPTTLAPDSGSVTVTTQCADNANIRSGFSLSVRCNSDGTWSGTTPQCQCNSGYVRNGQICRASCPTCPPPITCPTCPTPSTTVCPSQPTLTCPTCPPPPTSPSIGSVTTVKVLDCGVISWEPPSGNEGIELGYAVRFFTGQTYDSTRGADRAIQRYFTDFGRQWAIANATLLDGRTLYSDIRAGDSTGSRGQYSGRFIVANSSICTKNCSAKTEGLVRYPTALAPDSGSVTVTTQCADNANIRSGFSLSVRCNSDGTWSGTTPQCQCNSGYVRNGQICRASCPTCPPPITCPTCPTPSTTVCPSQPTLTCPTCPPPPTSPSIGSVTTVKVLDCGVISWEPPPGNEGIELGYAVRFFTGQTYDSTRGADRAIQRYFTNFGRQWAIANATLLDGRTLYSDIRAGDSTGSRGQYSGRFIVANSSICTKNCSAKTEGLVHYPTALAPDSGSVTVTTQCADNANIRSGFSLSVRCNSDGTWSGTTPQCQCSSGYRVKTVSGQQICEAIPRCEAKSEGLVRFPTTSAPNSGSTSVTVGCADNAGRTTSGSVRCNSDGTWSGTTPQCQCNSGYVRNGQICQASCPPPLTCPTPSTTGCPSQPTPTCPPQPTPPPIGSVTTVKVLECGVISWEPPSGNEGIELGYAIRFFTGQTYDSTRGADRAIQRYFDDIGRQWAIANATLLDGRTLYSDIRAKDSSGRLGSYSGNFQVANSSICTKSCQAKSEGLVRYPNSSSPNQGSVAVSAECVDNAHRISSSLTVMCNADGTWSGATPRCRCNSGYAPVNIGGEEICQADCPVNGSNTLPLPSPTYPPPPSSNSTPATPTTSATFYPKPKLLFGVYIVWNTTTYGLVTTLEFSDESNNVHFTFETTLEHFRLDLENAEWLKKIDDDAKIFLKITIEVRSKRDVEETTTLQFTKKDLKETLAKQDVILAGREGLSRPADAESFVDGTSIAIAIVLTFTVTAAAIIFLCITLGLVLHKRSKMKKEKKSSSLSYGYSMTDTTEKSSF